MKTVYLLLTIFTIPCFLFAQDIQESGKKAKSYVSSEYNRNSVTLIGLNFGENLSTQINTQFANLSVPEKFYDNPLQNKILVPGSARETVSDLLNELDQAEIAKWLNQNKVGQQILSTWFNRQSDGSFNVDVLKERGLFNADDNEYIVASASKRGESSLMDMGLQLVNQSYIVVFDFINNMTMADYYTQKEVLAEKQIMNGYRSTSKSYLFKLDFNDSVAAVFFQDYWTNANDPNKQSKIEAFENTEFSFIALSKTNNELSGTQYNPGQTLAPEKQKSSEELIEQMVKTALESVLNSIEKQNEDFRVKAMVSNVKPIAAKIGKKEGLKFDQRYFVFENRSRRNGTLYSKRIGVVKSMKVVDNRQVTAGQTESSAFYQIAGGKVDNYGMFLEQNSDIGLNVFLGTTVGGLSGFTGRAEYYISKAFGGTMAEGKSGKGLTSIKIYAEGAYGTDTYDEKYDFLRGSVGLSKDFYPLNFLHWGPFVGYGVESTTWESTEGSISSDFIEMGARIGVNLAYNIQLIGSLNYYMLMSSDVLDENKEVFIEDFDYKEFFDDRFGVGVSLGLRIMF